MLSTGTLPHPLEKRDIIPGLSPTLGEGGAYPSCDDYEQHFGLLCLKAHIANLLEIREEANALAIIKATSVVSPSPAPLLVLDESNSCGPDDCNIQLVNTLMRFVCSEQPGICLYVVTQNDIVADRLCKLSAWQRIGPLEGLTNPKCSEVLNLISPSPDAGGDTPWAVEFLEWNRRRRLTVLLEIHYYPEASFAKRLFLRRV